jgi:hypothetical protein
MLDLIAINERETLRIVKRGKLYIFQVYVLGEWGPSKETDKEWLASKWILQFDMRVSTDYPTIEEIKNQQK